MSNNTFNVAVVGLGALGSGAAYHASVKGASIIGFEQYEFGNVYGSSHDTSRIVRTSYGSPDYVALARAAYKDWTELERRSGLQMLTITGGVVFFPRTISDESQLNEFEKSMSAGEFTRSLDANGIPYELLDSQEVKKRWPAFDVPEGVQTIYTADSGIVHASKSVAAMQYQARANGAVLKEKTRVDAVIPNKNGKGVTIKTSKGNFYADKVILACDAWINKLLAPLGSEIPLTIMQEQVTYYKPADLTAFDETKFPVWIWAGDRYYYGFPMYGEPAIKAGRDTSNNFMTPENRTFVPSEELFNELTSFMGNLIPEKGEPLRTITCQYAITPDRQFVISPLKNHPNIIVGLGGGHAFKFAPAIGRVLAELAIDGTTKEDISNFGIPRLRKKIRCPGERPECSACARLRQHCSFIETASGGEQSTGQLNAVVSSRLEQLEDKLDSLISRVAPQSMQETTPSSTSERQNPVLSLSAATPRTQTSQPISTSASANLCTKAVEFYFRHIHRQPLWLFDEHLQDASDDLIYALMALFTIYHASSLDGEGLESPDAYYKAARTAVMLTIAQGSMTIRSSQTLCLLAYYNFILGDVATASFDISVGKSMMQLLPDNEITSTGLRSSQVKARIFWSLQFLSYTCGAPILVPSIPQDIRNPRILTVEAREPLTNCIPTPRAVETGTQETLIDLWSESLKVCNLWIDVRLYVAKCVEGQVKLPWHPDSDYTKLCSQLLGVEMAWPVSLSYNGVKFPSMPAQEAHTKRLDLLPWIRVQVTYHAIHFNEKGLKLADPFFAQAAAIASTLHLYWTRTSDRRLKAASRENLDICRKLVKEMAAFWPVCKTMENALDHFIESIEHPSQTASERASSAAVKTSLIWILLDVAAPQFPNFRDKSVKSQTFWAGGAGVAFEEGIPHSEVNTPPADMRESTARYATPPRWMMERTQTGSQMEMSDQGPDGAALTSAAVTNDNNTTYDLAWGAWENLGPMGDSSFMNMDWWDMNQF
ncbi:sarcosine oxidase [Fusarium longipes]|uniref:Sarcosine oxidase n=1 Tax=Fusarium longipes TaxID=694270 RepID=A0A395SYC5_9HYPO|nr:sarcosine oxidase [Fusarium longipes]